MPYMKVYEGDKLINYYVHCKSNRCYSKRRFDLTNKLQIYFIMIFACSFNITISILFIFNIIDYKRFLEKTTMDEIYLWCIICLMTLIHQLMACYKLRTEQNKLLLVERFICDDQKRILKKIIANRDDELLDRAAIEHYIGEFLTEDKCTYEYPEDDLI